jgi:hypothetical protein
MYTQTLRVLDDNFVAPTIGQTPDASFDIGYTLPAPIYLVSHTGTTDVGKGVVEYDCVYSEIPKDRQEFSEYQWQIPSAADKDASGISKPFSATFTALDKFIPYSATAGNIPRWLPGTQFVGSTAEGLLPALLSLTYAGRGSELDVVSSSAYSFSFTVVSIDNVTGEVTFTPALNESASRQAIVGMQANLQRASNTRISFVRNYSSRTIYRFFLDIQGDLNEKRDNLAAGFNFNSYTAENGVFDLNGFISYIRNANEVLVENEVARRWLGPIYYIPSKYIKPSYKIDSSRSSLNGSYVLPR